MAVLRERMHQVNMQLRWWRAVYAVNFSTAGIQRVHNNRRVLLVTSYSSINYSRTSRTSSFMSRDRR